jgi:hypothetical protein
VNPFFIMALQLDLDYAAELAPHAFERFASLIDPAWIDEALQQTGTVSLRRRRLPAERMVWLVIGLALFRNEPIWHIVQQLIWQMALRQGHLYRVPQWRARTAGRDRRALHATLGDRTGLQENQARHAEKYDDAAQQIA